MARRRTHIPLMFSEREPCWSHEAAGNRAFLDHSSMETSPETTQKTGEKARGKKRKRILELITDNPSLSLQELANEIGISLNGIVWQIKKEKILERVGPDKGGGWKVLKEEGE